jgi:L-2-hydroxyglutarate oxidase LhgO
VRGRQLLYDFCARHGVVHRRCGKLIVATAADDIAALDKLQANALTNGVADLQRLSAAEAQTLEPALRCVGALLSPSTGIVDSHGLMLALLGEAEGAGAMLALRAPVTGGRITPRGIELEVGGQDAQTRPMTLRAATVVNSAGLHAPRLARALAGLEAHHVPRDHLAKGCYYTLPGRAPFSRLVYPAPGQSSHLGVHLTLDLGGQARFGPSFEWVDRIDYTVDPAGADAFYGEVRRYWPALPDGALQPGYAGLRPKISGPGEPAADFRIDGPALHGVPGLVNLFGIESPGLTSSLAIAEQVLVALGDRPSV